MDGNGKTTRLSAILGIPGLDARYLPPVAVMELRERAADVEGLGALVLYGSVVRGEASPKSDIDVLAVPATRARADALRKAMSAVLREIENGYDLRLSFSLMVYSGKEDSHFLWGALQDGAVIFCRPETAVAGFRNFQPVALVSYSLGGLDSGGRQRVRRFLFRSKEGVSVDQGNRQEYIAPGVVILPLARARRLSDFFDGQKVRYALLKLWK